MTKSSAFLGTLLGAWHTENYLAAVIDDLWQAEQALEALRRAGWSGDDLRLFHGPEVARHIETIEQNRSLPSRMAAVVRGTTSEEGPISERYQAEAEEGHQILAVYADEPEQVERARRILAAYHAHDIKYFGSWVISDLPRQEAPPPAPP